MTTIGLLHKLTFDLYYFRLFIWPDAHSGRLVVKSTVIPLSTEQLIQTFENNQSTIMFMYQGHNAEKILRNGSGTIERFRQTLEKHPPVYRNESPKGSHIYIVGRQKNLVSKTKSVVQKNKILTYRVHFLKVKMVVKVLNNLTRAEIEEYFSSDQPIW
jgi:hypothetical protein